MTIVLAASLLATLAAIGVALNHVAARLGLLEVTLNEGLPPGHEVAIASEATVDPDETMALLGPGLHLFLSRGCHACMRLIDELAQAPLDRQSDLHLRYIDRPRPIAATIAAASGAELHTHEAELATRVGADPLPYTIAVGEDRLQARGVTPTRALVVSQAHNAGLPVDQRAPTAGSQP